MSASIARGTAFALISVPWGEASDAAELRAGLRGLQPPLGRWGGAVASVVRAKGACVEGLLYELGNVDLRALDRFEGHPFAYERVIRWVRDERGRRRRVMTYLQPEDGFEAWTPPLGYFTVLWHAYSRLGFDVEPLARAAGVSP